MAETGETRAERRRRLAALGGEEESDSDDDGRRDSLSIRLFRSRVEVKARGDKDARDQVCGYASC
jgi:hypothetical protein